MSGAARLMFFHGLESGPVGRKSLALREALGPVICPDFRGQDLEARRATAEIATRGAEGLIIIGSSFGGLIAALLADAHPQRLGGLVLCAPALHREPAQRIERVPRNALIIHGRHDEVVPIEASRAFSARHCVPLRAVEDGHRLVESLEVIVEATREVIEATRGA